MSEPRSRRLRALVRKETYQLVRDPSSILIAVVLPLILLFIFGYGVSLDPVRVPLGVVVESPSPAARELAASFAGSRFFEVHEAYDRRALGDALVAGRIKGLVVVPATFDAGRARRGEGLELQVIVDGTDPNTASFVQAYVAGAVSTWVAASRASAGAEAAPLVAMERRVWFNPELTSRYFLVPGSIAIVMTLIGTMLTALVVAREWERGTMEALMATPVTSAELLLGKLLPYFVLGLLSMALCVVVAVWFYGVPFRGSVLGLLAISVAFLLPALGQGLLISAAAKNQFIASQIALLTGFLPAFILSGFLFEVSSMPTPLKWLAAIVPARWFIPSVQTVFLAGDVWFIYLRGIGIHLLAGAIFFLAAARSTRKRLD